MVRAWLGADDQLLAVAMAGTSTPSHREEH
jgi:hypothetical protein